ncbi:unnamed protein product [Calicophoron daubneyi]|uniref:Uncharacterized protein n=1 Tax=Calicophoron daubneyi TaxID=300641 RepID=A0AAV2TTA3_CALDB
MQWMFSMSFKFVLVFNSQPDLAEQVDWIKASIDREVYLDLFGGGDPEHHQCTWPRASAYGIDAMHIVHLQESLSSGIGAG